MYIIDVLLLFLRNQQGSFEIILEMCIPLVQHRCVSENKAVRLSPVGLVDDEHDLQRIKSEQHTHRGTPENFHPFFVSFYKCLYFSCVKLRTWSINDNKLLSSECATFFFLQNQDRNCDKNQRRFAKARKRQRIKIYKYR